MACLLVCLHDVRHNSQFDGVFVAGGCLGDKRKELLYAVERVIVLAAGYFHSARIEQLTSSENLI